MHETIASWYKAEIWPGLKASMDHDKVRTEWLFGLAGFAYKEELVTSFVITKFGKLSSLLLTKCYLIFSFRRSHN